MPQAAPTVKDLGPIEVKDLGPIPTDAQTDKTPNAGPSGVDRLLDWLPAIGGFGGGLAGGIGGTVFGVGVGGPPSAIMGAALGGAAGEAYKQLINRARGKTAPETSGDAAVDIGTQAAVQGAAQGVGEALAPGMQAVGGRIMQSAVKPGLKHLLKGVKAGDTTPAVVKTLLDEGVNVTPAGVAKLQGLLSETNAGIRAAVDSSTARISPLKAAGRLSDTARTFATQANPQADLRAISTVGENFLKHPSITGPTIPITLAQALKEGTYARIGEKYGQVGAASIEAEKALARGLKEQIALELPNISALNAQEGRLLEALDAVGRRVAMAGNRDPVGFAWVTQNPLTFLAALMDRSPAVKSMLARGLYSSAGTAANVSPQLIRAAVVALTTESGDGPVPASDGMSSGPARR